MSLNHIRSDKNLKHLIERFWNIENYRTVNKGDPKLLPKSDSHAIDIPTTTANRENNTYSVGLLWKEDAPTLPNNRVMTIDRIITLEKKLIDIQTYIPNMSKPSTKQMITQTKRLTPCSH